MTGFDNLKTPLTGFFLEVTEKKLYSPLSFISFITIYNCFPGFNHSYASATVLTEACLLYRLYLFFPEEGDGGLKP